MRPVLSRHSFPLARTLSSSRANKELEQIPHLSPPDEGMTEGKLRDDLVPISASLSLAEHVALFDQLGQNPVGGTLGDPDRGADVAQPDARVLGDADQHLGVVREERPCRRS